MGRFTKRRCSSETRLLGTLSRPRAHTIECRLTRVSGVRLAHEQGSCLEEPAMPTYEYHCKKCGMTFEHVLNVM